MPFYENVFIARQDLSQQALDEKIEKFAGIIGANGGKVTKKENWGLRSLVYRIKKNRKGRYVLMNIDAPAPAVFEMERQMKIDEDIIRFLTVSVEELEEGPSAICTPNIPHLCSMFLHPVKLCPCKHDSRLPG